MPDILRIASRSTRTLTLPTLLVLSLAACGDDTAPVITLTGAESLTLEFGDTFTDPGATVTDDKDDDVEVVVSGSVDTQALGVYTLSYDAEDDAGNAAETVTRTVSVVDTTPPVITLTGEAMLTIDEGTGFTDPGATVTDAADSTVEVVVTGTVDADRADTYVLAYDATDASGNAATTVERTVEVVFDGDLAIVSSGADLVLVGLKTDGTLVERAIAPMPGLETYNSNHMVFGLAQDASSGDIFATSFNDCGSGGTNAGCWGNARIDRYSYDLNTLTHEGMVYLAQSPLRLLPPTNDAPSEVNAVLLNQGDYALVISEVLGTRMPDGVTVSSDCDGVTLAGGDTCNVVIGTPSNLTDQVQFTIATDKGTFYGEVDYDDTRMTHVSYGVDVSWDEEPNAPTCTYDDFGYVNQIGGCALTALAISQDGTRVYVNEDNDDIALVFALEGDGSLSFLSQGTDRVRLQGIAVHPSNNTVYNGSNTYEVEGGTTLSQVFTGSGGNATAVVTFGGQDLLISTLNNSSLAVLDLTDPLAPAPLASLSPSAGGARFQHHNADGSLFAVVDLNNLSTVSFDGTVLTELANIEVPVDVGPCEGCSYQAHSRIVQVVPDGSHALTGAFVNPRNQETADLLPFLGLLRAYSIDPGTGALAETDSIGFPGTTRAMLLVDAPE